MIAWRQSWQMVVDLDLQSGIDQRAPYIRLNERGTCPHVWATISRRPSPYLCRDDKSSVNPWLTMRAVTTGEWSCGTRGAGRYATCTTKRAAECCGITPFPMLTTRGVVVAYDSGARYAPKRFHSRFPKVGEGWLTGRKSE